MKALTRTFNFATPFGGALSIALMIGFALLTIAALKGFGFRFDPFNQAEARADRAEQTAAHAGSDASARGIEAAGAADTTTRVEVVLQQAGAAQRILTPFTSDAKAAPDANAPLDPARAARLRDVDEQLCAVRPSLCAGPAGGAATSQHAGDGATAVPAGRPTAG